MRKNSQTKVLVINASPRAGGNTDIVTDRILEAVKNKGASADKITLNNLRLRHCQGCDEPGPDGGCNFDDGMSAVYEKFKLADVVILASPIFFGSISGQAKAMVDRFQCAWRAKYVLKKDAFPKKKIGAFIAVAASGREDFFKNAEFITKNLFATLNIKYRKGLFLSGIEEKGGILKRQDYLRKVRKLSESLLADFTG